MKGKCHVFNGEKQRNNVCLVYLEQKLKECSYSSYLSKLKCQKTEDRRYLDTAKQQTRHCLCFLTLKCLWKGNNCVFGLCQQTSKVKCMCSEPEKPQNKQ